MTGQAVSWLSTLVVIRLLTPGDYGLLAMAMLFLGFFFMVSDLGFGSAIVQARELGTAELRELFGINLLVNAACAAALCLGAPAIAGFFGEPGLVAIIRVLSVNFILVAIYAVPQALLVRELEFGVKSRIDVAAMLASAATSLTLAVLGFGVWALVASMVALQLFRMVLFLFARPLLLLPRLSLRAARPLMHFGLIVTLDRVLYYVYGQADVAIGARVLGAEALGIYTVALTLAAMPMEKVLPVVTQVSAAAFARIQADPLRVKRNVLRAARAVSLGGFPAFLGMAAVAPELVPAVLGPEWRAAVLPFQVICLVLPLRALAAVLPPALFGIGRPGVNLGNMAISAAVMGGAFLLGVRHGVYGLAMAWLLAYPGLFLVTTGRALRTLQIGFRDFLAVVAFPAFASALMYGAVRGLRPALEGIGSAGIQLGVLIGVGVLVYAAMTWIWNRGSLEELRLAMGTS